MKHYSEARKPNRSSKAYHEGYQDGLAWDLDGYGSQEEFELECEAGWAIATIQWTSAKEFAESCGIPVPEDVGFSSDAWYQAMCDYDAGAHEAVTSTDHRGKKPGTRNVDLGALPELPEQRDHICRSNPGSYGVCARCGKEVLP